MLNKINEKVMYTSYKRSSKWLGIIDYKSLCFILAYIWIIFSILEIVNISLEKSIYIFLFLTVPIISVVIINVNSESAINVIFTIIMFIIKKGIYVDRKNYKKLNCRYK